MKQFIIKFSPTPLKKNILIVTFLIFYSLIIGQKLIFQPTPFYDWDESIYVRVGQEMLENRSVVPIWNGRVWLDKPPLVPLFYGTVIQLTPFVTPEISTRLTTLLLSNVLLILLYATYQKVLKARLIATITVVITAFTPIFLQRAQMPNIDIFLLIGWLGFLYFHKHYLLSSFFLLIGVLSKSLLGFYPIGIMALFYTYRFFTKSMSRKQYVEQAKKLSSQALIGLIWYIIMFLAFGMAFWEQHIIESHTKRVTASIESHFGQRTYYIDLVRQQFGIFFWFGLGGIVLMVYDWYRKHISDYGLLNSLYLLPWFLFLNITKTKIFWYSHPVIPQFAYAICYPLIRLKRYKRLYYASMIVLFSFCMYYFLVQKQVQTEQYSSLEAHHEMAQHAKEICNNLHVLVDPEGRKTIDTLQSMNLTITTTTWWGSHPSIMYYFEKPVEIYYSVNKFKKSVEKPKPSDCYVVKSPDLQVTNKELLNEVKVFGDFHLFIR